MAGLGTFLVALAGPIAKKVLVSLGVGIASYAAVTAALTAVLSSAKGAWGGLGGDALALIQMAGIGVAASIYAGALMARVSLMVLNRLEIIK